MNLDSSVVLRHLPNLYLAPPFAITRKKGDCLPTLTLAKFSYGIVLSLMKNLLGILVLLAFAYKCYAQAVVPPNVRAIEYPGSAKGVEGILGSADMLYGIPLPEGKIIGDTYLDTHWKNSSILVV